MKTAQDLRKEFEELTGQGTEIPDFINEPITFTQNYVHWLEKNLINSNEQTSRLQELVKAYKELNNESSLLISLLFDCLKEIAIYQATTGLKGERTPVLKKEIELSKLTDSIELLRQKIAELESNNE